jgi:hypothetical protein
MRDGLISHARSTRAGGRACVRAWSMQHFSRPSGWAALSRSPVREPSNQSDASRGNSSVHRDDTLHADAKDGQCVGVGLDAR